MPHISNMNKQQGAVLVVSLIMLLVLTIIGVTSMRTTVLEEKMAGNMNDSNLAFQAAEAALRDGEAYIESISAVGAFNGTGGLYGLSDDDPDFFASATWSDGNSREYSGTLDYVSTQPRYIIKNIGQIENNTGSLKMHGNGARRTSTVTSFRVTARGTGKSDTSQAILQAYYGRNM